MNKKYGNLVIVMHKLTAILGGYWRKLGKNMVDIVGNLAYICERIIGKIWWILPKAGKQNGGYTRKHIIKRKKFRLYTKTYN